MDHNRLQQQLGAFTDGELSKEERSIIQGHLLSCEPCRQQLEEWTRTRALVLDPLHTAPNDVFVQAVMRRVRNLEPLAGGLPWFARWAMPTLAFSVASFAASLIYVLQPAMPSTEALLLADRSSTLSARWLESSPSEAQVLSSVVTNP